jgi:hypothetical protein
VTITPNLSLSILLQFKRPAYTRRPQDFEREPRLTIGLFSRRRLAFCHNTLILKVEVPAICLALGVFQREREDRAAFLDRVLALCVVG